jgi:hypothetical protein
VCSKKRTHPFPKLRLRSDFQFFHDPLTLRCNEIGAAAKLSGDLFVCFALSEAPQHLLLLRRQLVAVRRWYLPLQVGPPIRSNRANGEITLFASEDQRGAETCAGRGPSRDGGPSAIGRKVL